MSANWMAHAACQYVDAELFFPLKGGSTKEAKRVCRSCEVRAECLAWALAQPGDVGGIWAGTSVKERRLMRRMGLAV